MKKLVAMLSIGISCAYAQADKSATPATKTVTVTGCISKGVECLLLKDVSHKQDYSIAKTDELQIGHAYRITGPVSDIGFCQEGKPILGPDKVTEVRLECQAAKSEQSKKLTQGFSSNFNFEEALKDAMAKLPPPPVSQHPDVARRVKVVSIEARTGGNIKSGLLVTIADE